LDFVGAEAPLFPVVRKGDHIDVHASLTVKDLRDIVVSGFIQAEKSKTVTAYTFRHQN